MSDIEDVDSYLLRIESVARRNAWGIFIFFLALSFVAPVALIVDFVVLFIWLFALVTFTGFTLYQEYKLRKCRFRFWAEVNAVIAPSFKSFYIILSGATLGIVLLFLLDPIYADLTDHESQPMVYLPIILLFLLLFPIMRFAFGYRMRIEEGKVIKHFRGQKEDAEKAVVSTLRSLGVRFRKTGRKWTLKMPSYEVEELGIIIQVYGVGNNAFVTIQSSNPLVASKVGEIERSIDSILGVAT